MNSIVFITFVDSIGIGPLALSNTTGKQLELKENLHDEWL